MTQRTTAVSSEVGEPLERDLGEAATDRPARRRRHDAADQRPLTRRCCRRNATAISPVVDAVRGGSAEPPPAARQTSRKRRMAMAEPMEPIAIPTMTTTTFVRIISDPVMCMAVKMLLVVFPLPQWLMKR